jgi:SHS2 domain-containing protein
MGRGPHVLSADPRMPYEFLDDQVTADLTFRAWGRDLVEVFVAAADATANAMVDSLESIRPLMTRRVEVEAAAPDMLLLRFLDELIFHKDATGLILRAGVIRIDALGTDRLHLTGELTGEPIDPRRHELVGDVKAVTLAGLRVERTHTGWHAQVTLDV